MVGVRAGRIGAGDCPEIRRGSLSLLREGEWAGSAALIAACLENALLKRPDVTGFTPVAPVIRLALEMR